jgi:hypothetical protein
MSKNAFDDPRPLTEETLKELGFKRETCEVDEKIITWLDKGLETGKTILEAQ